MLSASSDQHAYLAGMRAAPTVLPKKRQGDFDCIAMLDAKTHFSALIAAVERGEEIIIARAGLPVAELSAVTPPTPFECGMDDGRVTLSDDFESYFPEGFDAPSRSV